jgi:hypothetical protein
MKREKGKEERRGRDFLKRVPSLGIEPKTTRLKV